HKLTCAIRGDVDGPRLQRDGPMLREPAGGRVDREAGELGRVAASRVQALPVRADRQRERPTGYGYFTLRRERSAVGVDGQHRYLLIRLQGNIHVVRHRVLLPLGSIWPFSHPRSTTYAIRAILCTGCGGWSSLSPLAVMRENRCVCHLFTRSMWAKKHG